MQTSLHFYGAHGYARGYMDATTIANVLVSQGLRRGGLVQPFVLVLHPHTALPRLYPFLASGGAVQLL
jgi:hypothetical protein